MLINLYNQLLVMSIVTGGLYLILKLFSAVTMKYFTASWHYYTYIAVYTFLLLPYYKLVLLFHFNFNQISQKAENGLVLAVYNIDWDVYAYEDAYGTSQLNMSKGANAEFNISWSPEPGVIRVGLYNRDTGKFYWAKSSTTSPLNGTITVPETGLYSFAVGNLQRFRHRVNCQISYRIDHGIDKKNVF